MENFILLRLVMAEKFGLEVAKNMGVVHKDKPSECVFVCIVEICRIRNNGLKMSN